MRTLHATHPDMLLGLDTESLRAHYILSDLFPQDDIRLNYSHVERLIIGGTVPVRAPLGVASALLERRELGIINIGGAGRITVDGKACAMQPRDGLYIGLGSARVTVESVDASNPARFYLVSAPAHAAYATTKISIEESKPLKLGSVDTANQRTIYQYIHPDVCKSSQLLMGLTDLERGSVWNTMPCHLHGRRSEVYLYFDLDPQGRVFHFMGTPQHTRHMIMANEQAVISPPWSIHTGVGTSRYAFIWAMAGDNQDFNDMDPVPTSTLR